MFVENIVVCLIHKDKLWPLFPCFSKNSFLFAASLSVRQRALIILFYKINTQKYISDVII